MLQPCEAPTHATMSEVMATAAAVNRIVRRDRPNITTAAITSGQIT